MFGENHKGTLADKNNHSNLPYQKVDVKKNKRFGNQNINSINIVFPKPKDDEMYLNPLGFRPPQSSQTTNVSLPDIAKTPTLPPQQVAQVLGRAQREGEPLGREEVEALGQRIGRQEQMGQISQEVMEQRILEGEERTRQAQQELLEQIQDIERARQEQPAGLPQLLQEVEQRQMAFDSALGNMEGRIATSELERQQIIQALREQEEQNEAQRNMLGRFGGSLEDMIEQQRQIEMGFEGKQPAGGKPLPVSPPYSPPREVPQILEAVIGRPLIPEGVKGNPIFQNPDFMKLFNELKLYTDPTSPQFENKLREIGTMFGAIPRGVALEGYIKDKEERGIVRPPSPQRPRELPDPVLSPPEPESPQYAGALGEEEDITGGLLDPEQFGTPLGTPAVSPVKVEEEPEPAQPPAEAPPPAEEPPPAEAPPQKERVIKLSETYEEKGPFDENEIPHHDDVRGKGGTLKYQYLKFYGRRHGDWSGTKGMTWDNMNIRLRELEDQGQISNVRRGRIMRELKDLRKLGQLSSSKAAQEAAEEVLKKYLPSPKEYYEADDMDIADLTKQEKYRIKLKLSKEEK